LYGAEVIPFDMEAAFCFPEDSSTFDDRDFALTEYGNATPEKVARMEITINMEITFFTMLLLHVHCYESETHHKKTGLKY